MSKVFLPFDLASELDKHFKATSQGELDDDSFYDLVDTLQAVGSAKNQKRTIVLFKSLPKEEVLRRTKIVVRLDRLLMTMQSNRRNAVPNTSST